MWMALIDGTRRRLLRFDFHLAIALTATGLLDSPNSKSDAQSIVAANTRVNIRYLSIRCTDVRIVAGALIIQSVACLCLASDLHLLQLTSIVVQAQEVLRYRAYWMSQGHTIYKTLPEQINAAWDQYRVDTQVGLTICPVCKMCALQLYQNGKFYLVLRLGNSALTDAQHRYITVGQTSLSLYHIAMLCC